MSFIVDTHVFLWAVFSSKKISKKAKSILIDPELVKLVSIVTLWEISLKFSLGKIDLKGVQPDKLPNIAKDSRFEILNLTPQIASTYHKLPRGRHKDPFDRILAWQAICQDCTLITKDEGFSEYKKQGLKTIW